VLIADIGWIVYFWKYFVYWND